MRTQKQADNTLGLLIHDPYPTHVAKDSDGGCGKLMERAGALCRKDLSDSTIASFHAKYKKSTGCWEWQASRFQKGYGQFVLARRSGVQPRAYAHRVAYVLAHGDIPAGLVVRHSCDNPPCVNPDHLVLGTQSDNVHDAAKQGHYSGPKRVTCRKLTDAQVAEIRASQEAGVVLAKRFGVTPAHISLIRGGHRRAA